MPVLLLIDLPDGETAGQSIRGQTLISTAKAPEIKGWNNQILFRCPEAPFLKSLKNSLMARPDSPKGTGGPTDYPAGDELGALQIAPRRPWTVSASLPSSWRRAGRP
jgi:hypothetical protein